MKRKLAFFLSLIMIFSIMAPIGAFAEQTGFDVSGTSYATIQEAVAALTDNATLTMYEDAQITASLEITENNVTINGNGKVLTVSGGSDNVRTFDFKGSSTSGSPYSSSNKQKATVKNLTVNFGATGNGAWSMMLRDNTNITFDEVTINAQSGAYGFYQDKANSEVNFKNSTLNVTAAKDGYEINNTTCVANIENSTIKSTSANNITVKVNNGQFNVRGENTQIQSPARAICVYNKGVLNIENGTVEGTGSNPTMQFSGGTVVINGGTFISEKDRVIRAANAAAVDVTINDGTFTAKKTPSGNDAAVLRVDQESSNTHKLQIKVNGGTFQNLGTQRAVAIYYGNLNIAGGTFTSKSHHAIDIAGASTVTISGGTLTTAASEQPALRARGTSTTNITGGTISNTSTTNAIAIEAGVTVNISGGKVTSTSGKAIYVANGTANISGGEINAATGNAVALNGASAKVNIEGGYITSGGGNATVQFHKEGAVCNVYGGYIYNTGTHRAISADSALAVTLNIYGGTFVVMATNACVNISDTSYSVYGGTFINLSNNTASRYTAAGKANLDNAVSVIHMAFNPPTSEAYVTTANNKLTVSVGGEEKNIYYNISGGRPEMEIGAAVRLLGETAPDSDTFGNGIRFTSHFSSELINSLNAVKDEGTELSYGTLIVPTDYLDTLGLYTISRDVLSAKGYTYVDIKASNGLVADADGGITIRAALTDLKTENLGRDFSAVAYVSYVKDGKTVYAYAAYNETNNSRSMSFVAQAALDDLKDSEQSYYKFAVEVEGVTKYSPYNDEQRATLKKYIPAAN